MSSYSVYGNDYKDQISEKFVTKPASVYAINKKKAENLLLNFSKKYSRFNDFKNSISLWGRFEETIDI